MAYGLWLSAFSTVSCGLMDLDVEEQPDLAEMHLERDTLYIMVGDQFTLKTVFTPDTTATSVFFTSSDTTVLRVADGVFTGIDEGWAQVRAVSVGRLLEDSCAVSVMRRWELSGREFPYEMMVYADVSVHDQPFNPQTMMLAAFVDDELRGMGQFMEWKGRQYVRFRVGSNLRRADPEGVTETVSFRVYYRQQLRYEEFPQTLEYDGEAHGTLSDLYKLKL